MLCLRLAAGAITDADLAELQVIADQFEDAARQRDAVSVMNLDRRFHEKIALVARNPILQDILNVLHARSQRFWAISLASERHLQEVIDEHRAIVAALRGRDADAAADAARTHVLSF